MNRLYQFMNWPEIEGLVYSECSHPMELLGAHMCRDGMLVQVFRPDAVEAEIHIAGRKKAYACEKVDRLPILSVFKISKDRKKNIWTLMRAARL